MNARTEITNEVNLQIVTAIEQDDRSTLNTLLKAHGINCYLERTWEKEVDFEKCFYECKGTAVNIAVHLKNEALAVDLLCRGADVLDSYHSSESALGWSDISESLIEEALYHRMPELARALMSRTPCVDWEVASRTDCDAWSAGRWLNPVFLKVLTNPDIMAFLEEVGLFAGSVKEHQVNIVAEAGQFRVRIGEEDHGLQPTMAAALYFVKEKVGYVTVDCEAEADSAD